MAFAFADTNNMIAYLTKSDASEGFDQIINFLNASSIKYTLTVNPNIYVSCIKQFWSSVLVKKVNDVTRLQALVDKKKVIITEATIRDVLRLDDAESIDCLPNEEIFTELSKIGYEKPSTKLTFYKAFFSPRWKAQVGDLSLHSTKYSSSALTQKVFANIRRVGKGFSRVDTPLFEGMIVAQQDDDIADEGAASVVVDDVPAVIDEPFIPSPPPTTQPPPLSQDLPSTSQVQPTPSPSPIAQPPSPQQQPQHPQSLHDDEISMDLLHTLLETCTTMTRRGMIIASMDADVDVTLKDVTDIAKEVAVDVEIEESADVQRRQAKFQAQIYQIDLEQANKVLSMQDDELEPAELKEVVEVVTTVKLMTEVKEKRSGKRDLEETATPSIIIHSEAKSKDKGKWILVKEPKPLKKQGQIEQDEAYARELEAELNKNIDWDEVIEQVQRKEKEDNVVMRNMAGFKMEYFKGIKYDDIRPIFEKYIYSNVAFLEKTKEKMEEEDSRAVKRTTKSQAEKAAKRQKLDKEVAELKRHLQIVPNYEDDVYTEATPLARKVPVVDYEIYTKNNKPYYKIIRVDGSPQLFLSFLSLLINFDREDLEVLWKLVKERFASSKPKNFSDDF
uniref:Xylulose kinase-1 n=1 Tax=Tanacetum cinerariifolium TaxID=118510 RepID=A0A699I5L2_TANCI|nr:xylulose kinase-1 [Tanacetum cinerariifolium]